MALALRFQGLMQQGLIADYAIGDVDSRLGDGGLVPIRHRVSLTRGRR
jgi:hypothetical protein